MKFLKGILFTFSLVLLVGCSTSVSSASPGEIILVNLDQIDEKVKNQDSFIVYYAQSDCGYCHDFDEILSEYIPEHPVKIFKVLLDQEENATPADNLARVRNYFPTFHVTPSVYYVENGIFKSDLNPESVQITKDMLEAWVKNNHLENL
ncbi:hypothetical protein [Faecalicoccus pleomorphus]|uniref:hypothetical protein n=1 Tax=Faecalicoccus pleomorphus TaxID=1323 RepID=UPI0022E69D0E|nr:hypothetical protein [Faecalicoccus pleomorphus]